MLNIFFTNKRDRRSLFIGPLFSLAPLRKNTPTAGFFELCLLYKNGLNYVRII